jgi:hypothetical protein
MIKVAWTCRHVMVLCSPLERRNTDFVVVSLRRLKVSVARIGISVPKEDITINTRARHDSDSLPPNHYSTLCLLYRITLSAQAFDFLPHAC